MARHHSRGFVPGSRDGEFDIPEEYLTEGERRIQNREVDIEVVWVPSPLNTPEAMAAYHRREAASQDG